ncbi:MAG: hypothetical protein ABJA76_02180, partial [Mucilaginibacter sp.]
RFPGGRAREIGVGRTARIPIVRPDVPPTEQAPFDHRCNVRKDRPRTGWHHLRPREIAAGDCRPHEPGAASADILNTADEQVVKNLIAFKEDLKKKVEESAREMES